MDISASDKTEKLNLYRTVSGDAKFSKPVTDLGLMVLGKDLDEALFMPRPQDKDDATTRRQRLEQTNVGAQTSTPLLKVLNFMQNRKYVIFSIRENVLGFISNL